MENGVVVIVNVMRVVSKGMAEAIRKVDGARHVLGLAEGGDAVYDVVGCRELGPVWTSKQAAGGEAEEIVGALNIAGGPKTDSTGGAGSHIVRVFLVYLGVGTKWNASVAVIIKVVSCEEVAR